MRIQPPLNNHKDLYNRTFENGKAIAVVRTEIKDLRVDIKDIKDNHLNALDKKMDRITGGIVLVLFSIIAGLAIQFIIM